MARVVSLQHPADMPLWSLRDAVLAAAECVYDPFLHTGPDVFEHEPKDEREAREAVARAVCDGCTVRDLCLEYALRIHPAAGVWAGLTAEEVTELACALRAGERGAA